MLLLHPPSTPHPPTRACLHPADTPFLLPACLHPPANPPTHTPHRYSAALRLDPSLPPSAVNARVEAVMDSLGLTKIRRSTVLSGTGVSGVSGGERRRVAIAMELVIDPQVRLFVGRPLCGEGVGPGEGGGLGQGKLGRH